MRLTYWFSIFCCFVSIACERTLPFPEISSEPVLVANSIFKTDTAWQVQLTQSVGLDSNVIFPAITNGQVQIKNIVRNEIIPLIHQDKGLYTSDKMLPTVGTSYQLIAKAEGFSTIQSNSYTPNNFFVKLQEVTPSEYQKQPNYLLDIEIQDNPKEADFYLIEVHYLLEKNGQIIKEKAGHFSFDPNSENEAVVIDHFNLKQSYLSDTHFNGQTYITRIGATSSILNQVETTDKLWAIIAVKSISEDGYRYEQSVERFENFDNEIFSDPIDVFSNIENGLGIFAGYVEQRLEVRLQ